MAESGDSLSRNRPFPLSPQKLKATSARVLMTPGNLPCTPHLLPRKGLELWNLRKSSPPLVVPKAPSFRHCVMLMRGRLIGWASARKDLCGGEPEPTAFAPAFARLRPELALPARELRPGIP